MVKSKGQGKDLELGRSASRWREWEKDGNNELEALMGSESCWREDTGVSELEGHDVIVREWRL